MKSQAVGVGWEKMVVRLYQLCMVTICLCEEDSIRFTEDNVIRASQHGFHSKLVLRVTVYCSSLGSPSSCAVAQCNMAISVPHIPHASACCLATACRSERDRKSATRGPLPWTPTALDSHQPPAACQDVWIILSNEWLAFRWPLGDFNK